MDIQKTIEVQDHGNGGKQERSPEREDKLHHISHAIHSAKNVDEILMGVKTPIQELFEAQILTIYAYDEENNFIYSKVKSGDNTIAEIQMPISSDSIAGFVAQEMKLINITDAHDQEELSRIHPDLKFDSSWDKKSNTVTKSVLAIPLINEGKFMGILQLVNKNSADGFNALDENYAFLVAETLALAFQNHGKEVGQKPTKYSFLIQNGFISEEELNKITEKAITSNCEVDQLLIEDVFLRKVDIGKSLASFYGMPYSQYDESAHLPDPEALGLEIETLRNQMWVPLELNDSGITILIHDPHNENLLNNIKQTLPQQNVTFNVGFADDISKYIKSYGFPEPEGDPELALMDISTDLDMEVEIEDDDINFLKDKSPLAESEKPASKAKNVFDELIATAIEHEVTDIHLEPDGEEGNVRVRLRQGGECRICDDISGDIREGLTDYIKSQAKLDPNQNQLPQKGNFRWQGGTAWADLDIVTYPTIGNAEDIMLRVTGVKRAPVYIPLQQMNFSQPNLECIEKGIQRAQGLCIVAGTHGTGCTTTLHALAGNINIPEKKIITVEDPVEITQESLRQIQINRETGLTYDNIIRTFIGNSPDALMVGDVTEIESLSASLEAAKQFLIISSFHAESPIECLKAMQESGADLKALGDVISFIIGQKLVRTLCHECKTGYHPTRKEFESLAKFYGKKYFPELGVEYTEDLQLKKPVGCKKCLNSGYAGYTALQEILEGTDDLKNLISSGADHEAIESQAVKDGKISLAQDGIYKIFKGDCDFKQLKAAFTNR